MLSSEEFAKRFTAKTWQITDLEWRTIAKCLSVDIEVYTDDSKITKNEYKAERPIFTQPLVFAVSKGATEILYTIEQARDAAEGMEI